MRAAGGGTRKLFNNVRCCARSMRLFDIRAKMFQKSKPTLWNRDWAKAVERSTVPSFPFR
jgi:hypothetical protein